MLIHHTHIAQPTHNTPSLHGRRAYTAASSASEAELAEVQERYTIITLH